MMIMSILTSASLLPASFYSYTPPSFIISLYIIILVGTCAAQMMAKDREEHRDYHLTLMGVNTWTVAGTHLYRVPKVSTSIPSSFFSLSLSPSSFYEDVHANFTLASFHMVLLSSSHSTPLISL